MRNSKFRVEDFKADHWFKVKITSRKVIDDQPEVDYTYVTAEDVADAIIRVRDSVGIGFIVTAQRIKYDTIIKELEHARLANLH